MPRMTFESVNKKASSVEYPKLFLEKGERARIVLIEDAPHMEWVNTLRAPSLVNGQPEYETVRTAKGEERQQIKNDFIGQHISIGNPEELAANGFDEADPVSVAGYRGEFGLRPTERRFAIHVIRYKTKPGSFEIQEPFQPEIAIWRFGEKIFSQLVDYAAEWGDLKTHDLLLGPCEAKQYQKFDINVAAKAEWVANDERKQLTAQVYKNNRIEDLSATLGRRLSREQVLDDFSRVQEKYNIAHGVATRPEVSTAEVADLGLGALLGDSAPQAAAPAAPAVASPEVDAAIAAAGGQPAPVEAAPAPAPAAAPAEPQAPSAAMSLDELLNL